MGFTKNYLINNRFDDTKKYAEEGKFTNGFKNKAIQLDSKYVIIHSSHGDNTYNKKKDMVWRYLHTPIDSPQCMIKPISSSLYSFCKNKKIVRQYLELVNIKKTKSKYDIVYFCSLLEGPWQPDDDTLAEEEKIIIYLSKLFIKKGYTVAVFANILNDVYKFLQINEHVIAYEHLSFIKNISRYNENTEALLDIVTKKIENNKLNNIRDRVKNILDTENNFAVKTGPKDIFLGDDYEDVLNILGTPIKIVDKQSLNINYEMLIFIIDQIEYKLFFKNKILIDVEREL